MCDRIMRLILMNVDCVVTHDVVMGDGGDDNGDVRWHIDKYCSR